MQKTIFELDYHSFFRERLYVFSLFQEIILGNCEK